MERASVERASVERGPAERGPVERGRGPVEQGPAGPRGRRGYGSAVAPAHRARGRARLGLGGGPQDAGPIDRGNPAGGQTRLTSDHMPHQGPR